MHFVVKRGEQFALKVKKRHHFTQSIVSPLELLVTMGRRWDDYCINRTVIAISKELLPTGKLIIKFHTMRLNEPDSIRGP